MYFVIYQVHRILAEYKNKKAANAAFLIISI